MYNWAIISKLILKFSLRISGGKNIYHFHEYPNFLKFAQILVLTSFCCGRKTRFGKCWIIQATERCEGIGIQNLISHLALANFQVLFTKGFLCLQILDFKIIQIISRGKWYFHLRSTDQNYMGHWLLSEWASR